MQPHPGARPARRLLHFFGLPRKLGIDLQDLERRFRDLSRKFHPDYFYNAPPAERLASLERSSYLNDAYRALRNPVARIEHLLAIEGLPSAKSKDGTAKVPPALLEEVFALNEELDEIREQRESGGDGGACGRGSTRRDSRSTASATSTSASSQELSARWDASGEARRQPRGARRSNALRERLLERNYINNLLATIEREGASLALGTEDRRPETADHG